MNGTYRDPALPDVTPLRDVGEFQFALTEAKRDQLYGYLFPDDEATTNPEGSDLQDDQYERGVIGVITRSSGQYRTTHLLHHLVPPETEEDVYIERRGYSERLFFGRAYKTRATLDAEEVRGGGLIYFHSHPGWSAYPSDADREADRDRLYDALTNIQRPEDSIPLAAGIVAERQRRDSGTREWSIRGYDFSTIEDPSEVIPATATSIRIVGPRLQIIPTAHGQTSGRSVGNPNLGQQDSALALWGDHGQSILAELKVGVAGCGGVGSLLAEQLARLGVGEAVFVDFDRIKPVNLNRAYGATRGDAEDRVFKADVASRVAKRSATARGFESRSVIGSVVENSSSEYAALGDLLDCDVILNAADHHWARMVLDNVSRAHLIPVIDGGSDLAVSEKRRGLAPGASSEISITAPAHPCLECMNAWRWGDSEEGVNREQLPIEDRGSDEDIYFRGEDPDEVGPRAPSVATTNGVVASMMMERFNALVLSTSEEILVGGQRYLPALGTIRWRKEDDERKVACDLDCNRSDLTALGDGAELKTGTDHDLREEIEV